jgi:YggT family protein
VELIGSVLSTLLFAFLLILIFRLVMEYVFLFARSFRPSGFFSVILEAAYTVTDPPLNALRRVIPPLKIGQVAIDLSFIVLFIIVSVLRSVVDSIFLG